MAGANGPSVTAVAAFGVVLAGFLFGLTSMQAGPRLPAPWRAVSAAVFAVLVSIVVAWLVGPVFGALPASFLMTGTLAGLLALAVGVWTTACRRASSCRQPGSSAPCPSSRLPPLS